MALADLKKRNAAELDEKRRLEKIAEGQTVIDPNQPQPMDHEKPFYPKYGDNDGEEKDNSDSNRKWNKNMILKLISWLC